MGNILKQGEPLVLATVLKHQGSTPRKPGAKMVVRSDGRTIGTIGGGVLESMTLESAARVFETKQAEVRTFDLNENSIGMFCGGQMEILTDWIAANQNNSAFFRKLDNAMRAERKGLLVTSLEAGNNSAKKIDRCLIITDDTAQGNLQDTHPWAADFLKKQNGARSPTLITYEGRRLLIEPFRNVKTLYLFGGGHISLQVAQITMPVGFRTIVLDDREEYANCKRFSGVDGVRVVASFEAACSALGIDQDCFLVIVTRGHAHDRTVLAQALRTNAGYIGMLGSKRKRDVIYESLFDDGFTPADLKRVHCPIGLNIGGETPAEIAVSIVAELIKVRSEQALS